MLNNVEDEVCYICYDHDTNRKLFSPCSCKIKVHEKCLIYWIYNRPKKLNLICEVCQNKYNNIFISKCYLNCFNRMYKCLFVILLIIINYFIAFSIFIIWDEEYITIGIQIFVFIFVICFSNLICCICGIMWNFIIVDISCMKYFLSPSICFNENKYYKSPSIKETFSQESENENEIEINIV